MSDDSILSRSDRNDIERRAALSERVHEVERANVVAAETRQGKSQAANERSPGEVMLASHFGDRLTIGHGMPGYVTVAEYSRAARQAANVREQESDQLRGREAGERKMGEFDSADKRRAAEAAAEIKRKKALEPPFGIRDIKLEP